MSKHDLTSAFELEGRFIGFTIKDHDELKHLRLSTSTGEYTIKLSKDLRRSLPLALVPGEWLRVSGKQKQTSKMEGSKLKAKQLYRDSPSSAVGKAHIDRSEAALIHALAPSQPVIPSQAKACILICQKSDCCKRGGRQVAQALQEGLGDRALTKQVTIKGTGCMKRCKDGPNIVMSDKTRYTQIRPEDVPAILDRHFSIPSSKSKNQR
jgi:(2Fe-2S) ferredoxin